MRKGKEFKSSGITENTPKTVMLGAGTIHRGLVFGYNLLKKKPDDWTTKYTDYFTRSGTEGSYEYSAVTGDSAPTFTENTYYYQGWNFEDSLICATSGGSKMSIVPEFYDIPVDGALVKVKGLTVKVGETATFDINPIELTPEIINQGVIGNINESETAIGYTEVTSRAVIDEGDYLEHMGYVGKTIQGDPIIIIFDYAMCTSGLSLEGKNKEAAIPAFSFECFADLTPEADTLPWHIYYPTPEG